MLPKLVLAPIKGYTDPIWRSCYFDHFSGIDKVVTPFLLLSEHNRAKRSYFRKFLPELGRDVKVVPQYLIKDPETILYSAPLMAELGVKEFNLNMGCPAPAIFKKGRGSGLMENLNRLEKILDSVVGFIPGDFTVKIRTGIEDSSLIEPLIKILNRYELKEVIVHPRFARQRYEGIPDMDAFDYAYNNSSNPISYNGDINCVADFFLLNNKYPKVSSWMIGRGILRDPFLPNSIKTGEIPSSNDRIEKTVKFINDFASRLDLCYEKKGIAINRVKAAMIYIASYFNDDPEFIQSIKRCKSLDQMLTLQPFH